MPTSRSKIPTNQVAAETPVTMEALHVIITELTSQIKAIMNRFSTRLDKVIVVRLRLSLSISLT